FSAIAAFFSAVLNPVVYHSFRYVDWRIATSTPASSNTSLVKSSSEYFMNFSSGQCVSSGPRPMYAWKHSIQPFAYCSCPLTQFAGLASQKCWWPSTTKYFSPFFSYMPSPLDGGGGHSTLVLRPRRGFLWGLAALGVRGAGFPSGQVSERPGCARAPNPSFHPFAARDAASGQSV